MLIAFFRVLLYYNNQPNGSALLIDRVIFNGVPDCESIYNKDRIKGVLCRPYLQVFLGEALVYSSNECKTSEVITITRVEDSFSFHVGMEVHGDVLIRLRHFHSHSQRDSVCRIYFNTSYIEHNYLRAEKVYL